jgi:predicted DNA binding CopG/RHH family protein
MKPTMKRNLNGITPMRFELEKKEVRVNMRMPEPLLAAVKKRAIQVGVPYQRFIRHVLEQAVEES